MPEDSCIFCAIVAGRVPATRVFEDEEFIAFKDIRPKAPVHYLVVPRRHTERLDELADIAGQEGLGALFDAAVRSARATGLSDFRLAVNVGEAAGQEVFHTHVHVLAGW